ncbi:MAG: hypothetical protein R3B90_17055 [Planctomycetaceae bacterium]
MPALPRPSVSSRQSPLCRLAPPLWLLVVGVLVRLSATAQATTTWDGRHNTDQIKVTVVYFVPADRAPLPDWRERVDYYCRRIEAFHEREFQGQSVMRTEVVAEPYVSALPTATLREGDGDAIFFKTLREVDAGLKFATESADEFPILLVLSEINWRPLDDFYRLHPTPEGPRFEGNYNGQEHFPGAASGGARATYIARERKGWGLVTPRRLGASPTAAAIVWFTTKAAATPWAYLTRNLAMPR